LREQLNSAKQQHQKVWVMAHVPPGVDTYASFHKFVAKPEGVCSVSSPVMMLNSDDLARTLTEYASEVKLAIFAHTHMDEIKLLHSADGRSVPAKLVPSISPVNGNVPAFVVAQVQPQTAVMLDYAVYAASDAQASSWSEEYRYSSAYRMPDYSGDSVAQIASRLAKDKSGSEDMSATYQRWFLPGDDGRFARGLRAIWPSYACAVQEDGGPVYRECMCPGGAAATTEKAAQ
jgi:sphingomyelin phosphodiesterase acid-like 3